MSDSSPLVDDSNPRVQYQPGWDWQQGVLEVDATRHAASIAGLTAWLPFVGSSVAVVGTLGESATYGQPRVTFSIDGKVAALYEAPFVATGNTQYNVTFFSAGGLSAGDHEVLINSTLGAPNTFFLDYFLIGTSDTPAPSPQPQPQPSPTPNHSPAASPKPSPIASPSPTPSSSKTATTTPPPAPNSSSIVTPQPFSLPSSSSIGTQPNSSVSDGLVPLEQSSYTSSTSAIVSFVTVPVTAATPTPSNRGALSDNSSASSDADTGAIVGAAVGGVVVLAVLLAIVLCLRRRRRMFAESTTPLPYSQMEESHHTPVSADALLVPQRSPGMQQSSLNGRVIHISPGTEYSHRAHTGPPSEFSPTSSTAASDFESRSSPSEYTSTSAWRAPQGLKLAIPSAPTEKSHSPYPATASTHSLGASTSLGPSTSMRRDPPSSSSRSLTPAAILPPGEWHAPPESHPRAQSLLRMLLSPRSSRASGSVTVVSPVPHDTDSGLRLYNEPVLPPPYTQD